MTSGKRNKARTWVLGGAGLLIAAAVAMILWRKAGGQFSGQPASGPPSQSISGIASPVEPEAAQGQGRTAIEAGRFDRAFELYRKLDGRHWSADDCLALGTALLQRDRIVLGWSALEAARKIDPKSSETLRAIEAIEGKLALAKGDESKKLLVAEARVQVLRAIAGGPPLGLLVVGLAAFASDSGQEEEFLDRIGVRDRVVRARRGLDRGRSQSGRSAAAGNRKAVRGICLTRIRWFRPRLAPPNLLPMRRHPTARPPGS